MVSVLAVNAKAPFTIASLKNRERLGYGAIHIIYITCIHFRDGESRHPYKSNTDKTTKYYEHDTPLYRLVIYLPTDCIWGFKHLINIFIAVSIYP